MAYRQYETEIELLVKHSSDSAKWIPGTQWHCFRTYAQNAQAIEEKLMEEFEAYKTILPKTESNHHRIGSGTQTD